jgi:hypothetical protein
VTQKKKKKVVSSSSSEEEEDEVPRARGRRGGGGGKGGAKKSKKPKTSDEENEGETTEWEETKKAPVPSFPTRGGGRVPGRRQHIFRSRLGMYAHLCILSEQPDSERARMQLEAGMLAAFEQCFDDLCKNGDTADLKDICPCGGKDFQAHALMRSHLYGKIQEKYFMELSVATVPNDYSFAEVFRKDADERRGEATVKLETALASVEKAALGAVGASSSSSSSSSTTTPTGTNASTATAAAVVTGPGVDYSRLASMDNSSPEFQALLRSFTDNVTVAVRHDSLAAFEQCTVEGLFIMGLRLFASDSSAATAGDDDETAAAASGGGGGGDDDASGASSPEEDEEEEEDDEDE